MGPSVLYKTNFIESIIDATVNAKINDVFYLGAGYRGYTKERKDALVTNLAVQIAGTTIGYSFDWGLHTLKKINKGTHEVLLRYVLDIKGGKRNVGVENLRYLYY